MENLWAPWRMQFIEELRNKKGGCVFCELAQQGDDKEKLVLVRGKSCYVVMNRFPYNNGHLLILPYKHTGDLSALGKDEYAEMMELCARSIKVFTSELNVEGVNCGFNFGKVAGAGITDHLHMHVVPRWIGDTNFLPIISDTRSMPEYLSQTYDRLAKGFAAF